MSSTLPIATYYLPPVESGALAADGLLVAGEPSGVPTDGTTVGSADGAAGLDDADHNGDLAVNSGSATSGGPVANGDAAATGLVAQPLALAGDRLPRGEVVYLPPADDAFIGDAAVWAPNPLHRFVGGGSGSRTAARRLQASRPPPALPDHAEIFCRGAAAALAEAGRQDLWRRWANKPQPLLHRDGFKAVAGRRRQALGWSGRRVGELLGVSSATIYDYESPGSRDWQADIAQRLGWLYCLHADWLAYKGFPVVGGPATWLEITGRAAVLGWDARTFEARLGLAPSALRTSLQAGSPLPEEVWRGATETLRARLWPAPRGEFGHVLVDNTQFIGLARFLLGAWHMSQAEMAAWFESQGYAVNLNAVEKALDGTVTATSTTPNASQGLAEALGFVTPRPPKPPLAPPQFYDGRFSALLEARRCLRRWSLADLAERAAVDSSHLGRLLRFRGEALIDEFGPLAWRLINLTAQALDVPLYDLDTLPRVTFATACDLWLDSASDAAIARHKTGCAAHDAVALVRALRRALFLTPTELAERVSAREEFGVGPGAIQALEARLEVQADDWVLDDRERTLLRKLLKILAVDVDPLALLPRVVLAAGSDQAAVGEALRQAFAQSLYSKGELVAKADIYKTILARILNGEYAASNPALRRVAGCLNVVLPAPVLLATKPRRGAAPEPVWVEGMTQWRQTLLARLSQHRLGKIRLGRKFGWTTAEWEAFRRGEMPLTHPRLMALALTLRVYGQDLFQLMLDQCDGSAAEAIRRFRLPPDAFDGPFYRLPALTDGALVATLARRGRLLGLQSAARLGLASRNLGASELGFLADSGGDLEALLGADSGLVHALLRRGDAVSAALYLLHSPAPLAGEERRERRVLQFLADHRRWRRQVYGEDAVGPSKAEALRFVLKGLEGGLG